MPKSISYTIPRPIVILGNISCFYGGESLIFSDQVSSIQLTISASAKTEIIINDPENGSFIGITQVIEYILKQLDKEYKIKSNVKIEISGKIDNTTTTELMLTVGIIKGISEINLHKIDNQTLFEVSKNISNKKHKLEFDNYIHSIIHGDISYFNKQKKVQTIKPSQEIQFIKLTYNPNSKEKISINGLRKKYKKYQYVYDNKFELSDLNVQDGVRAINNKNYKDLGNRINYQQKYLDDLTLVSENCHKTSIQCLLIGLLGAKKTEFDENSVLALKRSDKFISQINKIPDVENISICKFSNGIREI